MDAHLVECVKGSRGKAVTSFEDIHQTTGCEPVPRSEHQDCHGGRTECCSFAYGYIERIAAFGP